jgi:NAD(P)H dehydrogenase (quinone)
MSQNQQPTLLVTGASGHLGRRVVELLSEKQAGTIIAATRTPEKLADLAARGVITRKADFDDPASLAEAFKGVDRLLLISTDAIAVPGQRLNQHRNAVKAAEDAGVKHVIYTSIVKPDPDSPVFVAPDHRGTEEALAASKLSWTVLRENVYTEVLLGTLTQAVQTGKLFSAAGDGKIAYVTREDIAQVAAAVLLSGSEGRQTLNITGPEALTQAEIAAIASEISERQIDYVPLTLEVLIQNMVGAGLPQPMAEGWASFDAGTAQGKFDVVSNVVEEITGRKATSVREFLTANREALLAPAPTHAH